MSSFIYFLRGHLPNLSFVLKETNISCSGLAAEILVKKKSRLFIPKGNYKIIRMLWVMPNSIIDFDLQSKSMIYD